jgi:hypothetical protein
MWGLSWGRWTGAGGPAGEQRRRGWAARPALGGGSRRLVAHDGCEPARDVPLRARGPSRHGRTRPRTDHQHCEPPRRLRLAQRLRECHLQGGDHQTDGELGARNETVRRAGLRHPHGSTHDRTHRTGAGDGGASGLPAGRALGWLREQVAAGRAVPPEQSAQLVVSIAAGCADALSGRYLSIYGDVLALVERAKEIQEDDLYVLRVRELCKPRLSSSGDGTVA